MRDRLTPSERIRRAAIIRRLDARIAALEAANEQRAATIRTCTATLRRTP